MQCVSKIQLALTHQFRDAVFDATVIIALVNIFDRLKEHAKFTHDVY